MRKLLATIAITLGLGSVAALGLAKSAGAAEAEATGIGVLNYATASYSSPSNASAPVHYFKQHDQVETVCFTEGQTLKDNPYWIRVSSDGRSGYVHRDAISAYAPDLRHC